MPDFQYIARELSGREVTGLLTAGSEQEAVNSLTGKSLFPTKIALAEAEVRQQQAAGKRVRARHIATIYSQLADLLASGVPLLKSLEILEQQSSKPAVTAVLQDVRQQVAEGTRLADAMRRHPNAFNELALSMVRAGEEGGFLEDALKRVSIFTEHQEDLKNRVVGAMVYPMFLMGACLIIVTLILVFLVPQFAPIFERLDERGELPWATVTLLGTSAFLQHYGLWLLAGLAALSVWIYNYSKREEGRLLLDTWRLKLKGLGPIVRSLAIARFCRILGTLLKNGVPILQSLRIAKDASGNRVLSAAIGTAAENISAGKSLARPLGASGHFPREVVEMIAVGEEANNLEQVLLNISENMEQRTYRELDMLVKLLEPLMLLVMGVIILFIMVALLLPVVMSASSLG
jgi:general secretion pathway protein F/type IV pilus assembly protein PilC